MLRAMQIWQLRFPTTFSMKKAKKKVQEIPKKLGKQKKSRMQIFSKSKTFQNAQTRRGKKQKNAKMQKKGPTGDTKRD